MRSQAAADVEAAALSLSSHADIARGQGSVQGGDAWMCHDFMRTHYRTFFFQGGDDVRQGPFHPLPRSRQGGAALSNHADIARGQGV